MDHRLTVAELEEIVRAMELKLKDLSQQQLEPQQIIRKHEGQKYFGFKATALNEKIRNGEIPTPVPLSDTGRAMGWFGHQVISHQQKLLVAARAAAEKAATAAPPPRSRAGPPPKRGTGSKQTEKQTKESIDDQTTNEDEDEETSSQRNRAWSVKVPRAGET